MKYIDLTFSSPEKNLAFDEALLDFCEKYRLEGILRFWEPETNFIVLGYSNLISSDIRLPYCRENQIPIFRRCTGGGTVLQGKGCLNYSLILGYIQHPELSNITHTNQFIMTRHKNAIQALIGKSVKIQGHTDLTLDNLKFSGNSQRRKRTHLLFHGTFLINFNIQMIDFCLTLPRRQPAYRANRPNLNFLTNLNLNTALIKKSLQESWSAINPLDSIPEEDIDKITKEKYLSKEWIERR